MKKGMLCSFCFKRTGRHLNCQSAFHKGMEIAFGNIKIYADDKVKSLQKKQKAKVKE